MTARASVGITPRDRVDRVLTLLASEVGPRLLTDRKLADTEFRTGSRCLTVGRASNQQIHLDASECCKIILAAPGHLFVDIRPTVEILKGIRDRLAHPRWAISESEAVRAATAAATVLRAFGRMPAALAAERYREGPMIRYVTRLRTYLIERCARQDPLISYETALSDLSNTAPGLKMSEFLRQLNVLAALQMILGEPQLCALVVLNQSRLPGDGFFWTIDVPTNASEAAKRTAHKREVAAVKGFSWRPSEPLHALPW